METLFAIRSQLMPGGAIAANWIFLAGIAGWIFAGLIGLATFALRRSLRSADARGCAGSCSRQPWACLPGIGYFTAHTFVHAAVRGAATCCPAGLRARGCDPCVSPGAARSPARRDHGRVARRRPARRRVAAAQALDPRYRSKLGRSAFRRRDGGSGELQCSRAAAGWTARWHHRSPVRETGAAALLYRRISARSGAHQAPAQRSPGSPSYRYGQGCPRHCQPARRSLCSTELQEPLPSRQVARSTSTRISAATDRIRRARSTK